MVFTIHTSTLFDPKKKCFLSDISIVVDPVTGSIVKVYERKKTLQDIPEGDVDLRGKVVMPGFVEAHSHIFVHDYRCVGPFPCMNNCWIDGIFT